MKEHAASGLQIAFLIFAALLLAAPIVSWLSQLEFWTPEVKALLNRGGALFLGLLTLLLFPALRHRCLRELAKPIPPSRRAEVACAAVLQLVVCFGAVGAMALAEWLFPHSTSASQGNWPFTPHDVAMSRALTTAEVLKTFLLAGILAPIVEELVFRGFLYRAWERQWGWIPAMLATSLVFAAYHRVLAPAFLGSILFVCLLRRTGTLWAPILCHCVSNLLLWYPLAGQWIAPAGLGTAAAQLSTWSAHIALLGVTIVLLGSYVWMSRDAAPPLLPKQFDDHAPLPR